MPSPLPRRLRSVLVGWWSVVRRLVAGCVIAVVIRSDAWGVEGRKPGTHFRLLCHREFSVCAHVCALSGSACEPHHESPGHT